MILPPGLFPYQSTHGGGDFARIRLSENGHARYLDRVKSLNSACMGKTINAHDRCSIIRLVRSHGYRRQPLRQLFDFQQKKREVEKLRL